MQINVGNKENIMKHLHRKMNYNGRTTNRVFHRKDENLIYLSLRQGCFIGGLINRVICEYLMKIYRSKPVIIFENSQTNTIKSDNPP